MDVSNKLAYVNRKKGISTNVMIVCDFNMKILFIVAGGEGCSHDASIYRSCVQDLKLPDGMFILGDAAYPLLEDQMLSPYRSTLYHLPEWRAQLHQRGFADKKEAFNYLHSSARMVIERCIGVLKARFRRLSLGFPRFKKLETLAKSIITCAVLHNWVLEHEARVENQFLTALAEEGTSDVNDNGPISENNGAQGNRSARAWRDAIATQIWEDRASWQ